MPAEAKMGLFFAACILSGLGIYYWYQDNHEAQQLALMNEPGSHYLGPHEPQLVEGYSGYHIKHDEGGVTAKICRDGTKIYKMPNGKYITDGCDMLFGCFFHYVVGPDICQ
jgi:hypothetical protein